MKTDTILRQAMKTPSITRELHEKTQRQLQEQPKPAESRQENGQAAGPDSERLRRIQGMDSERRSQQTHHPRRTQPNASPGVQKRIVPAASRAWLKRKAIRDKWLVPQPVTDRTCFT